MINREIVTYLKSEKDIKKGFVLLDKEKKKDKPQYLPYLLIIYYFGPTKPLQNSAKKLMDSILPKEVNAFNQGFIEIVKKIDKDIASLRKVYDKHEEEFSAVDEHDESIFDTGELDFVDNGLGDAIFGEGRSVLPTAGDTYQEQIHSKIKEEFLGIKSSFDWIDSYLQIFMLPVYLFNDSHSVLKIKLEEHRLTNFYLTQLFNHYSLSDNSKSEYFENNHIFLNHFLDDPSHYVLGFEQYDEDIMCFNCVMTLCKFMAMTKDKDGVVFFEKILDQYIEFPQTWYEFMLEEIERLLGHFDDGLTRELRFKSEWLENPLPDDREKLIEFFKNDLSYNSQLFEKVPEHLKSDKEVVMAALMNNGQVLEYASEELKEDSEVVMAAVRQDGKALEYASKELRGDKEVVMAAVKNHAWALEYASKELKADKRVVTATVKADARALQFASKELKADKKVVMAPLKRDGSVLEYVSKELKADKEVVMTAVKSWGVGLKFASKEFRDDKEVVMAALKNTGFVLKYVSKEFRNDKEIVMKAVERSYGRSHGINLEYASKELKDDREVVMSALRSNGMALKYASKKLKSDKEVVKTAVRNDSRALQYASKKLQKNKDV